MCDIILLFGLVIWTFQLVKLCLVIWLFFCWWCSRSTCDENDFVIHVSLVSGYILLILNTIVMEYSMIFCGQRFFLVKKCLLKGKKLLKLIVIPISMMQFSIEELISLSSCVVVWKQPFMLEIGGGFDFIPKNNHLLEW